MASGGGSGQRPGPGEKLGRPAPGASPEPETCGGRHSESLGPRTQGPRRAIRTPLPWSGVLVTACLKPASPLGLHTRRLQLQDFGSPGTEGGRVSVSS